MAADRRDRAVLEDVDAAHRGPPGIAPCHGIMPRRARPFLQRATHHRIAGLWRNRQRRAVILALLRGQPAVVDAVQPVGMDVPLEALHVMHVMGEHQHAPARIHDVVIQFLAEVFPQIDGVIVKPRAFIIKIVRPDDRGVAPGIAAAQPALVDHRDIGDAVLLGQIIGGTQTMPARADDDHVIFGLGLAVGPLLRPALVAGQGVFQQAERTEMGHGRHLLGKTCCLGLGVAPVRCR